MGILYSRKEAPNEKDDGNRLKYIRKALFDYLNKVRILGLDLEEVEGGEVFSRVPYQKKLAYEFIQSVKIGNLRQTFVILKTNKYLVYDYDWINLTGLHWACKRNHERVAELLIKKGADVNAKDLLGRTCLYFALLNQNIKLIKLLLYNEASPWSSPSDCNYKDLCGNNPKIVPYLQKSRELYTVMTMSPAHMKRDIWLREANLWFVDHSSVKKDDEYWTY